MKKIFEKTKVRNVELKNRIIKSAVWEELATVDGYMTDELFNIYEELAKGGVGLIVTGYAYVTRDEQPNAKMMGIYNDSFIENYLPLTKMVHDNDTKIVMQLVYGGSMSTLNPPSKKIFGPSAVINERTNVTPIEITIEEITNLVQSYVDASVRAKKAGFDGVELHVGHGYFLSQFLSNDYNQRKDSYGGSIENRSRIIKEIIQGIREVNGDDFLVMIKQNSQDFTTNGLTSEDSIKASLIFEQAGIDMIEVTGGNESSLGVLNNNLGPARTRIRNSESYFLKHATKLSESVNVPVILTGGNRTFSNLEEVLNNTNISYFALARPFISEPDLVNKFKNNHDYKLRCVSCNKCYTTYGKRCILNQKQTKIG